MADPVSILHRHRQLAGLTLAALATELKVDKSTMLRWERASVPISRVFDVERVTGISRHDLRPDVFGAAQPERGAA